MDFAQRHLRIDPSAETTWESSPETLLQADGAKIDALLASGVNRLNIGIQSFEAPLLRVIGRRHRGADAVRGFELARDKGFRNVNIDLIYGLPDQRMRQWEHTLDMVGELRPDSVTAYHLRVKPGTPISRLDHSRFPGEGRCRQMGCLMLDRLEELGYEPWQPNQFVRSGEHAHRYLKSKWESPVEVLGIGVSSYSFVGNWM